MFTPDSHTDSEFHEEIPGGHPAPAGMPRYALYYAQDSNGVPEGGSDRDFVDSTTFNRTINWAGIEEALPLSFGHRLYEAMGCFPAYDSKTWPETQYQAVLGSTVDAVDLDGIALIRHLGFRVRTNPAIVGKTLDQIDLDIPLFFVESTDPSLVTYGYDKLGKFIRITPPFS